MVEKLVLMRIALKHKFNQNPKLAKQLIETWPRPLKEGNYWHDNFFGDCTCDRCKDILGQNHLGKLLIKLRDQLRSE